MTSEEARDAIYAVFHAAWGATGEVVWGNIPSKPPVTETPWAAVKLQHTKGGQSTLSGETGTRRFKRTGIVVIRIFVPIDGDQTNAYQLAQQVANAYEDARLDVWFRNTRIQEVGASGAFDQINVLSDFQYDEVR